MYVWSRRMAPVGLVWIFDQVWADATSGGFVRNPEQSYPIIHVTGLMGKDLPLLFLWGVIYGHGKKLRPLPPHIISINDWIWMGQPIAIDFIRLANQVKEMEKTLQTHDQLSFFELLTWLLFFILGARGDLVLLEVELWLNGYDQW